MALNRARGDSMDKAASSDSISYASLTIRGNSPLSSSGGKNSSSLNMSLRGTRRVTLARKSIKSVFESANINSMNNLGDDIVSNINELLNTITEYFLHGEVEGFVADMGRACVKGAKKIEELLQMLSIVLNAVAAECREKGEKDKDKEVNHAKDIGKSIHTMVHDDIAKIQPDNNVVQAVMRGEKLRAAALRGLFTSIGFLVITLRGIAAQLELTVAGIDPSKGDRDIIQLLAIMKTVSSYVCSICSVTLTHTEVASITTTNKKKR
eukprot:TRINITY_DN21157_c0_g1_i1.p1 TRINITY_DN21157_c0_g1~~TRINITY_DN21157_c0_g1_i1.p1  ORF type:complete len:278 (-),score=68.60 TRINITY_DN21157_c0_g1_i1:449-1246(-)